MWNFEHFKTKWQPCRCLRYNILIHIFNLIIRHHTQLICHPHDDGAANPSSALTTYAEPNAEAEAEASRLKKTLYIAAVDAKKAFDMVVHAVMLHNLAVEGCDVDTVGLAEQLYTDLHSNVYWEHHLSRILRVKQGVRHTVQVIYQWVISSLPPGGLGCQYR